MYNLFISVQVMGVLVTLICIAILASEKSQIQQKLLMITIICVFTYCLGYTFELMSKTHSQAIAAVKIEYVGGSFIVLCYTLFMITYFKKKYNFFLFSYFFICDVLTMYAVLRVEECGWYYSATSFIQEGLFPHLVIERGPLYYLFFSNNVIRVTYAFVIVLETLIKQRNDGMNLNLLVKKRTLYLLLITPLIPFLPYALGSLKLLKYFDMVPLGFLIAVVVLLFIVIKDNIFYVVSGAHEQMFAAMNDAVIIVNRQLEFLEANKAAIQIFPSLFQYPMEQICPPEVLHIFNEIETDLSLEINGRYYERHSSRVYKDQTLIGYSVLLIDLTESNEIMKQLRELKDQADEANKAKSTFLANVSHELRTPLNAVIGYSDLIIQETNSEAEENHAHAIRKAADNLLSIINTILDISKIEAGKIDIERVEYDTIELFNEVTNIISIPAKAKNLTLSIHIDPKLPSALFGDVVHIRQVLINVLNNAVKFTDEGFVSLSITGTKGENGTIEMVYQISDSGRGIKDENLEHIFERFEQADRETNGSVEGTGLGLYITRSLVHLMGGEISVESEYGVGSQFTIRLLQRICNEDAIEAKQLEYLKREHGKADLTLYAPRAKVLSVDDNHINNGVFKAFCEKFGIQVTLLNSGYDAIELLKKESFDLVFLDQMMPGIDGIQTFQEITKLENVNNDMPILAFTANAIRGNMEYLLSIGFDDVILKPIGIRELEEILDYYLPDYVKENVNLNNKQSQPNLCNQDRDTIIDPNVMDVEIGLKHCNEDEELYHMTLQMVVDVVPKKLEDILQYMKEKEYESFMIEVHALKNNAALIGSVKLSEFAKELEYAAKDKNYSFIDERTQDFIGEFNTLIGMIQRFVS